MGEISIALPVAMSGEDYPSSVYWVWFQMPEMSPFDVVHERPDRAYAYGILFRTYLWSMSLTSIIWRSMNDSTRKEKLLPLARFPQRSHEVSSIVGAAYKVLMIGKGEIIATELTHLEDSSIFLPAKPHFEFDEEELGQLLAWWLRV